MGISNNSANVVLAKARAMYGRRLTDKDYSSLFSCSSVEEVVSYLKTNTRYNLVLKNVNENDVHRGMVEQILRQELFLESEALCKFDASVGDKFYSYIIERYEVDELNHLLLLYSAGKIDQYIYSVPLYFDRFTKINIMSLPKVRSYDDILNAVLNSQYYDILLKYKPKEGDIIELEKIENELTSLLYKNLYDRIKKHTHGGEKREILEYFNSDIDFMNFERIIRLRKYFNLKGDEIKKHLLKYGDLSPKQIDLMCNAESSKEIFEIMRKTFRGTSLSKIALTYSGEASERVSYKKCRKYIHFSTHPTVVMLSYIFLTKIEISNIVTIIESVRYNVKPEVYSKIIIN